MLNVKINNNSFKCNVVHTPEKTQEGMMGKDFDGFDGMLFVFGETGPRSFWMKDCIVPLDIIFINKHKITSISHNCPPCYEEKCPNYYGNGNMVLEVLGGTCKLLGIKKGDQVDYYR
jgi:uncharacterized protein